MWPSLDTRVVPRLSGHLWKRSCAITTGSFCGGQSFSQGSELIMPGTQRQAEVCASSLERFRLPQRSHAVCGQTSQRSPGRKSASVMAVSYARSPQPRTLLLLQGKGIVESNRNRGELREHRAHENDVQTGGGCC